VHNWSVQAGEMASLRILHGTKPSFVCATGRVGGLHFRPGGPRSGRPTANGRVLYAAQPGGDVACPTAGRSGKWRRLRESVREPVRPWPPATARRPPRGSAVFSNGVVAEETCAGRGHLSGIRGRCHRVCPIGLEGAVASAPALASTNLVAPTTQ